MGVLKHLRAQRLDAQGVGDWQRVEECRHRVHQRRSHLAFVISRQRRNESNFHRVPLNVDDSCATAVPSRPSVRKPPERRYRFVKSPFSHGSRLPRYRVRSEQKSALALQLSVPVAGIGGFLRTAPRSIRLLLPRKHLMTALGAGRATAGVPGSSSGIGRAYAG